MRVAVISDIHANLAALAAVLDAVEREAPDELWCLGDTVGYGPRPNECCALVRERADVCLVGNHDLVALGAAGVDADEFNPDAAAAVRWTASALDEESRAFLGALAPAATAPGAELFHASPRDPVWEYVLTVGAALAALSLTTAPLVLVGHTHAAFSVADDGRGAHARDGTELDLSTARFLLNPGSVGQPRDADPRAAWLLLDTTARFARFARVPYSVEQTQRELRAEGLPESLAARLAWGH